MKIILSSIFTLLLTISSIATLYATGNITALAPTVGSVGSVILPGQGFNVRFTTTFAPKYSVPIGGANSTLTCYFQVQLSDANGNFGTNPTIISTNAMVPSMSTPNTTPVQVPILGTACNEANLSTAGTYSVPVRLPSNIAPGNCYKIRVVCKQEYLVWSSPYTYGPNAVQNTPQYNSVASGCFSVTGLYNGNDLSRQRRG